MALIAFVITYFQLYKPVVNQSCEEGKMCATPPAQRLYKGLFWGAMAVIVILIASSYLIPLGYG